MKRRLIVFLLVLALVEAGLALAYRVRGGEFRSPGTLFAEAGLIDVGHVLAADGCAWGEFVALHPFWGHAYKGEGKCVVPGRNSFGLKGREIPWKKDPDAFQVLLVGGSMAEILGASLTDQASALEAALNETLVPPRGSKFTVINGAISGARQPAEFHSYLLFQEAADAVISLEGFNEHASMDGENFFEEPSQWAGLVAKREGGDFEFFRDGLAFYSARLIARSPFGHTYTGLAVATVLARHVFSGGHGAGDHRAFPPPPREWDAAARKDYFFRRYQSYLGDLRALTSARGQKIAIFFQPVARPNVNGRLASYEEMVEAILGAGGEGLTLFSFAGGFAGLKKTDFIDDVHLKYPAARMLARRMAEMAGKAWRLKARAPSGKNLSIAGEEGGG